MATCRGRKKDGTPCGARTAKNEYCHAHQDQAQEPQAPDVSGKWTRERLEAAVAANGGPEGLDLAGEDLSGLDLSGMDLCGAVFCRSVPSGAGTAYSIVPGELGGANLEGACLDNAQLDGALLSGANLRGTTLWHASLQGTHLERADLSEAILGDASLSGAELWHADLHDAYLIDADLRGAKLVTANLRGADLRVVKLQGANIGNADFQGADLRYADLTHVNLLKVADDGLQHVWFYAAVLDRTWMKSLQLGGAIGEEIHQEHWQAAEAYLALKQNWDSVGDYEGAGWAYLRERRMRRICHSPRWARFYYGQDELADTDAKRAPAYHPKVWWFYLRHTVRCAKDWLIELICDYGEGPWRTVASIVVLFLAFAAGYSYFGLMNWVVEGSQGTTLLRTWDFAAGLVFSICSMTTLDVPWLQPTAPWVGVVMSIEALLGIGLTGLLGFVLGNRIRRS